MSKVKLLLIVMVVLALLVSIIVIPGCKKTTTATTVAETTAAQTTAAETTAAQTTTKYDPSTKKIIFVQTIVTHPVHNVAQLGMWTKAAELGYKLQLVGTLDFNNEQTIQLGEAALGQNPDLLIVWAYNEVYFPLITKAAEKGIPVIVPHTMWPEGTLAGITSNIGPDWKQYTHDMADTLVKKLGEDTTIAESQSDLTNVTENNIQEEFKKYCAEKYPKVKVLDSIEIGYEGSGAEGISKVVAQIVAHPELKGAIASTGNGPEVWANAIKETGNKEILMIGMDATQINLDLIKQKLVYGVAAQPLYEENAEAIVIADKILRGEKVPYQIIIPTPIITQDTPDLVDKAYDIASKATEEVKNLNIFEGLK